MVWNEMEWFGMDWEWKLADRIIERERKLFPGIAWCLKSDFPGCKRHMPLPRIIPDSGTQKPLFTCYKLAFFHNYLHILNADIPDTLQRISVQNQKIRTLTGLQRSCNIIHL